VNKKTNDEEAQKLKTLVFYIILIVEAVLIGA
jgi:hypothetical protein